MLVHLLPDASEAGLVDETTVQQSSGNPDGFVECMTESMHTVDFPAPTAAVFDTYRFELDGEWQSFGINEFLTPDTVLAALDRYPELRENLLAQVRFDDALKAVVAEALETDPEFAKRHPDAAAAVR